MSYNTESWTFLQGFFEEDKNVATLFNKAISLKSKRIIRDSNFEVFINDICSTLPDQQKSISYLDMLKYVAPHEYQSITEYEELENAIIEHIWINILAYSSARNYFSKEIKQSDVPSEAKPYLILYSFGINADWFLYGGLSSSYFVDKEEDRDLLFNSLQKGYYSWQNTWHFYIIWDNLKSKLFKRQQLSVYKLYPLVVLLIVLRRELSYSIDGRYLTFKSKSLTRSLSYEKVNEYILYTLYKHFEYASSSISSEIPNNTPNIDIHSIIAKNLISSKSYAQLLLIDNIDSRGLNILSQKEKYEYIESTLYNNFKNSKEFPKRLLLDSYFPYTKVRDNDVFVPSESRMRLLDKIYLSFLSGVNYKNIYRHPYEDEVFDFIQIEPTKNSNNVYDDSRVIAYRKYLKPTGDFIIVQSKDETEKQDSVKNAFSEFRHDLKNLMGNESIETLSKAISFSKNIYEKIQDLRLHINQFKSNKDDETNLAALRTELRNLDNDKNIQINDILSDIIFQLRDTVEEYCNNECKENQVQIDDALYKLDEYISQKILSDFDDYLCKLNNIRYNHDTLCDYIKMAGTPKDLTKETFNLTKFVSKFISFAHINAQRVLLTFNDSIPEYFVSYNKTILKVMLSTIVDNAIKHGFEDYPCENPTIEFSIIEDGEYLILKVANNGKPIDILTCDYKTRGIFKGITGHTGLGGYLVSKYAERMGGYIDLPIKKIWNTEIDIYIKK